MAWFSSWKGLFQSSQQTGDYQALEEKLLEADVGVHVTSRLVDFAKKKKFSSEEIVPALKEVLAPILNFTPFQMPPDRPAVFFFVGVNGVGKTTTLGKLAHYWKKEGYQPLIVAGDTFRAAARDQLKIWAERCSVGFVGAGDNADPASVVYDGITAAQKRRCDLVLVDTAGRLHTKTNLMEQLSKMTDVTKKILNRPADEVFLILDATTGQNGLAQAKIFQESIGVTGIILTKYDSTASGGVIFSIAEQTGLPIRFLGVGEGLEDLRPFDPVAFLSKLF